MIPQAPMRSLFLAVILIAVCAGLFQVSGTDASAPGMLEITTDEDLKEYMKNVTSEYRYGYSNGMYYDMAMAVPEMVLAPAPMAAKEMGAPATTSAGSDKGASDFSTTNIQVAGVDEADFVKNDGKYIYIKSGDTLTIVDAFPPAAGEDRD